MDLHHEFARLSRFIIPFISLITLWDALFMVIIYDNSMLFVDTNTKKRSFFFFPDTLYLCSSDVVWLSNNTTDVQNPVDWILSVYGYYQYYRYIRLQDYHNYKSLYRVLIVFIIVIKLSRLVCTIPATFCRSSIYERVCVIVVLALVAQVVRTNHKCVIILRLLIGS